MRSEDIFHCQAERFEDGNLFVVLTVRKFAQFRINMFSSPVAFGDADDDVAGFFECGGAGINDKPGSLY